ncbi:MAG: FIST C-terminal domain-containing protein [Candidatus Omnitrophica bacterium]|nr:FIST C-terminal domain-containing protein [Candidatus Omnitrophota bacterium]
MAIKVGVGKSKEIDSFGAGSLAAKSAIIQLEAAVPNIVFVFASSRFDHQQLIRGIKSIVPDCPLVGCSTAGEITSDGPDKKSVVVMAIASNSLHAAVGLGKNLSKDSRRAGQEVAHDVVVKTRQGLARHAFMMLSDGLSGNGVDIIRGVQEVLGTSFPIVGGSAADDFLFSNTFQYYDQSVYQDSVCGILFSGDISIGIGARHGWYPLGKPRIVTAADHNIIKQLDGKPAARIYEDYFGKRVADLQNEPMARMSVMYPLGMSIPEEEECIIRNAMKVDADGALICAGEVPKGSEIRVMMGSKETALKAAQKAAEIALGGLRRKKASIVFVFDSVSRERLFGLKAKEEIEVVQKIFGPDTPIVGFYTYGEQAPLGATINLGQTFFHNETIVVFAIGE